MDARALIALVALAGCGEEAPPASGLDASLADLEASGYAGDDEGADASRAGVTLVADREGPWLLWTDERSRVFVMDRAGVVRHTYQVPGHDQVEAVCPLEGGELVVLSVDQGLTRFDADGDVRWQVPLAAHHEVADAGDGTVYVATHTERTYQGRRVRFDEVRRVSADGEVELVLDTWDQRADLLAIAPASVLDEPPVGSAPDRVYDRFHLNAIEPIPRATGTGGSSGDERQELLLCFRNADLIVTWSLERGAPSWHADPGLFDFPHMPRAVSDGGVLVFDNGYHRGRSRVLELDRRSGEVRWTYEGGLWTRTRGGAQPLGDGRVLITESERGRVLEVDRGGRVLWEWWNPILDGTTRRRLYRMIQAPSGWHPRVVE